MRADRFHEPDDVFAVDYINVRISQKSLLALLNGAHDLNDAQMLQVLPLGGLFAPGVLRHALRRDNQDRPVLQPVVQQRINGGQGRHCLAGSHPPQERTGRMLRDPGDSSPLVWVGHEIHGFTPFPAFSAS